MGFYLNKITISVLFCTIGTCKMKKTTFYLLFGICFLFAMATADDCNPALDDDCTCAIECPEDTCNTAKDPLPCVDGDSLVSGGGVCTCVKTCPADSCAELTESCTATTEANCKCTDDTGADCDTDDTGTGGTCVCTKPTTLTDTCGGTFEADCLCALTSDATPCDTAAAGTCECYKQCKKECDAP